MAQSLANYDSRNEVNTRNVHRADDLAIENLKRAYVNNPLVKPDYSRVIEGYFPKENVVRDMAIKKINKTTQK